jgi:hypothetical protein
MPTSIIWAKIDAPVAHQILLSAQETQKKLYKTALDIFSKQMGLRPQKVLEMPKVERHLVWQKLLAQGYLEALSFNLVSNWLMQTQSPLLCAWLDALGIPHNGNGVTDHFPPSPSREKLQAAIEQILTKADPKTVSIYLRSFNEIDGVHWPELDQLVSSDQRLQL